MTCVATRLMQYHVEKIVRGGPNNLQLFQFLCHRLQTDTLPMCKQVNSNLGRGSNGEKMWREVYLQFVVFIPGDPLLLYRLVTHRAKILTLVLVFYFPVLRLTLGAAVRCFSAAQTSLECMRVIAHSIAGPAHTASNRKKRNFVGLQR